MATVYNLEPQPTAKVLLTTTSGDLLLELFAKQTPLASRNFLQHCLDGYYTDTIFHRLVPEFIVQGGDPTATGHGGESIYPGPKGTFEDEFHTRLKFNRRGLLGMANSGEKDDNGSQFFLTLGETAELQGRNTMFGRIVGDTIYNLMKMGEADIAEGGERPMYPTKVTGAEILVNPFEDMVKRENRPKAVKSVEPGPKKSTKKGTKNKNLLSFVGDEAEEGEDIPIPKKEKFNPQLISKEEKPVSVTATNPKFNDKKSEKRIRRQSSPIDPPHSAPSREAQLPLPDDEMPSRSPSLPPELEPVSKMTSLLEKTNAQIADLKASMKRNVQTVPAGDTKKKSALERMMPESAIRGRKRKHGAKDEDQTLSMLTSFRSKLEKATPTTTASDSATSQAMTQGADNHKHNGQTTNDEEAELCDLHFIANCQSCQSWDQHNGTETEPNDEGTEDWMHHTLTFEKDRLGKDLSWKQRDENGDGDGLVVIDPREKAKDIREEQRAKKMSRMGGMAGMVGSGTAAQWGREREKEKGRRG